MASNIHESINSGLPEMNRINRLDIKVKRTFYGDTCTMGEMYLDGKLYGYTCEDKYRALNGDASKKVVGKTAIDKGVYKAILSQSTRFKRVLPELLNVPCFTAIRIHGGNTSDNSEGCILLGAHTDGKSKIWECAAKVDGLVAAMKGKEVVITIS